MSNQHPRDVVIVAAVRTAVTKASKGNLKDTRPDDLLIAALNGALGMVPGFDPAQIDDIVIGTAMPEAEQGLNVARNAALAAGIPESVPAMTINRFCASGLQSLAQAAAAIQAGWHDVALTGGVESMSQVKMGGDRPSPNPAVMAVHPEIYTPMGITSENVARRFEVSRADQDNFALRSNQKAVAAIAAGRFKDEIIPVQTRVYRDGVWADVTVDTDDGPRADTTLEGLGKLRAAFAATGASTAGNSSQVSDGAAATLLMSRAKAEAGGFPVLGTLRGYAVVGVPPDIMGIGPAVAIPKALEKAGVNIEDVDLFEINEAFASQSVYCVRELGIDPDKVNVNGGAIALGHPLGCTGAKLTATLLHELGRRSARYGVVSMCIGGGMGAAAVFENERAD
jgi:acetyl-CoA acyltransferase